MSHAAKHIHFAGMPGAGPWRSRAGLPMPTKMLAKAEGAR
jgi:hypothetical protein